MSKNPMEELAQGRTLNYLFFFSIKDPRERGLKEHKRMDAKVFRTMKNGKYFERDLEKATFVGCSFQAHYMCESTGRFSLKKE